MKSFLIFYIVFTLVYASLIVLTGPLLLTWGEKRTLLEQIYAWFLSKPFNPTNTLALIFLNSLFWSGIFYMISAGAVKLRKKN